MTPGPGARVVIAMRSTRPANIWHWPPAATAALRSQFPAIEFLEYERPIDAPLDPAAIAKDRPLFENAAAALAYRLDPRLWQDTSIGWIHCPSAAVHGLLSPELVSSHIQVTNGAPVHAATVAEHTLALMLALARGLPFALADQAAGRWHPHPWLPRLSTLAGATALIVGLGNIGGELARRLSALDLRVLGVRRRPDRPVPGCAEIHPPECLPDLLPRADYVVLALPATGATNRVMDAAALARLRPSARLLSIGRGNALDESALASALAAGRLAGAALDVFEHEPLPPASPLWRAPNLILSPHVAAFTPDTWDRQAALFARHLRRFLAGEPLDPVVDKRLGY